MNFFKFLLRTSLLWHGLRVLFTAHSSGTSRLKLDALFYLESHILHEHYICGRKLPLTYICNQNKPTRTTFINQLDFQYHDDFYSCGLGLRFCSAANCFKYRTSFLRQVMHCIRLQSKFNKCSRVRFCNGAATLQKNKIYTSFPKLFKISRLFIR